MKLPLIKYGSIALTIITTHRTQSPLCLLLLVRLGGYIVNSLDCSSYRLIGKLTAFFQLEEFSLRNQTVDSLQLPPSGVLCAAKSKSRQHPRH